MVTSGGAVARLCLHCMKPVAYKIVDSPKEFYVRNLKITYKETKAICTKCGHEIHVPDIADYNVISRKRAYLDALRGIRHE